MFNLAAVALFLSACSGEDCNWCPPVLSCLDGVVRQSSSCVERTQICAQGCRVQFTDGGSLPVYANLSAFCRGAAVHAEGDPCRDDSDCRPASTDTYLRCNVSTHVCIRGPQPMPLDYLASCDAADQRGTGHSGVTSSTCTCLFTDDGCLHTGCTIDCIWDADCPQGSTCDDSLPYWMGAMSMPTPSAVCRPGAAGTPLPTSLPCAP